MQLHLSKRSRYDKKKSYKKKNIFWEILTISLK